MHHFKAKSSDDEDSESHGMVKVVAQEYSEKKATVATFAN